MVLGKTVHWFVTEQCNARCPGCFRPVNVGNASSEDALDLANILVANGVRKVIFGGGEPTMVSWLRDVSRRLHENGVYVSLHTNGLLLNPEVIKGYSQIMNRIAIPIDAIDYEKQRAIRGEKYLSPSQIRNTGREIRKRGLELEFHTIFTDVNAGEIARLYRFLDNVGFDSWRIYEFNEDLALKRLLEWKAKYPFELNEERAIEEWEKLERLRGRGTAKKGYVDCLLGKFLLEEEKMGHRRDKRVGFVAVREPKQPYTFLTSNGDVEYYSWFSTDQRHVIGNLFREDFPSIMARCRQRDEKVMGYDAKSEEDWLEATGSTPIWTRLDDGTYFIEELEAIRPGYRGAVEHLHQLHNSRERRLERELEKEAQAI